MFEQRHFFIITTILLMGFMFSVSAKSADNSATLAEVNGKKVTNAMLERYQRRRGIPKDANPEQQKAAMIEELINRELIYQDGIKKGIDKKASVKAEINNQKINIIASAVLKEKSETIKVTDKSLKSEYEKHVKNIGGKEYNARHILLESEQAANEVVAELDKGSDFALLARTKSTGPSKDNDGDLGWFTPQQMVKPFADALVLLKAKEYSKKPVKTEFGWHIIYLAETRQLPPPSFEDLKEQLRMRLQNKNIESYIGSLRKNAKIVKKL